jgi:hypothetical protein
MDNGVSAEMPKYKCYKEVWALKISGVKHHRDGSATIFPEDTRHAPFEAGAEYIQKHKPEVGGYYVVYKDGYKSYSPAKAFEEGYSLITE